mmetsp:Transcript_10477/g.31454  ORF Transcript_10477/g.31454 Transcript_10477/m.31454 type:complete len:248 (+) Transcript_10477:387-1130(+)
MGVGRSMPQFSVIIPTLNEAVGISKTIDSALSCQDVEVLVVDGGSTDGTQQLAREKGVQVLSSPCGRGVQMNAGWRAATGNWCIFLHGDSRLPANYTKLILDELQASSQARLCWRRPKPVCWGAFSTIQTDFRDTLRGQVLSMGVMLRTRLLNCPYGDQAMFVERQTLKDLGGFKDWPFLEDYELVQRLRAEALPAIVPVPVFTSGRRWNKIGFVRTWAINQAILAGYHAGVHVESLARWYQEMKRS